MTTNDERMMRLAVDTAVDARLRSRPNPWVGAVVVATDGQVFCGATMQPGEAHAEVVALNAAGHNAHGATLYTTLEPCSHTGKTGPCTQAIINAKISRVVVGVIDPDKQVAGNGIQQLRDAGITVDVGVLQSEVERQLAPYLHHRRTGRPYVILKMAMTLDGRVAMPDSSQWITGETARKRVHQLRAESDAILVGAGTVRADNPSLTTRDVDGPSPDASNSPVPVEVSTRAKAEKLGKRIRFRRVVDEFTRVGEILGAKGSYSEKHMTDLINIGSST